MARVFYPIEHGPIAVCDLEGELAFEIPLINERGTEQSLVVTSTLFCEIVAAITQEGARVGRDYEFTIGAAVNSGAEQARKTPR